VHRIAPNGDVEFTVQFWPNQSAPDSRPWPTQTCSTLSKSRLRMTTSMSRPSCAGHGSAKNGCSLSGFVRPSVFRNGQLPCVFDSERRLPHPGLNTSPVARFERRAGPAGYAGETLVGGGLSLWAFGHNSNLELFYIRGLRDRGPGARDRRAASAATANPVTR